MDFIEHEHGTDLARSLKPRGLPLLADPVRPPKRRLICADVADGHAQLRGDLLDQGRLAHLAGTGHDLYEPARLYEPLREDGALRALEFRLIFTRYIEYFYSVY